MKFKQIILIIAVIFFISCSSSGKKETIDSGKVSSKDSCCNKEAVGKDSKVAMISEIACPKCGHKEMETMPTDVCVLSYECKKCKTVLTPKGDDCCVFCTYGTVKCPSKQ